MRVTVGGAALLVALATLAGRAAIPVAAAVAPLAADVPMAAAASPGEPLILPGGMTIYVDAAHGHDAWPGTRARPLRTVAAAWNRVPRSPSVQYTIELLPGSWSASQLPNYWQQRYGSATAPIVLRAAIPGTAVLTNINMFEVQWLVIDGIRLSDRFDLFHCERCAHVEIENSRFDGSQALLDTVKFNQSTYVYLRGDDIHGASQNPLQFVAVQHGAVTGNDIYGGGDWCAYFKGGSADLLVSGNRVHDCATGGLLAGQGSGLQFMVAPYDRYEAYGIVIAQNWIWNTKGAGIGVNGGFDVSLVDNALWNTGASSHTVEIDYGLRTCDGQPGTPGRSRCAQLLAQGAWGTTRVDTGANQVRIPDTNTLVAGNVIANPRVQGDELVDLPGPFGGPSQNGSGLGTVTTDGGLRIYDNLFAVGVALPNGVTECAASDCLAFRAQNTVTGPANPFADPAHGNLTLTKPWTGVPVPAPSAATG